ncbi:hypothetical protein [Derxia gummosa]|uniref:Uncharacterized protein n=1 Tax=Derxia gummosa DSM 723 TaxID=1121388 RepID=A0A8B6X5D9_9BURK|nr:hypothetical protein [Derxia gummosa]
MASISAATQLGSTDHATTRAPGELRLVVLTRLAPMLRHDLSNVMTVLKLELSGARARARRDGLDAARIGALVESLGEGLARLAEAQHRLVAWLDDSPATAPVGPTLAEIAGLLHGPCALRGRSLAVAAHALERNAAADRRALRMLVAAALLAIVDGGWPGGAIELDADSDADRLAIVIRRSGTPGERPLSVPATPSDLRLTLDDVGALARDLGWSLTAGGDELRLVGPRG